MKYSKIVLSGILSFAIFSVGCATSNQPTAPEKKPSSEVSENKQPASVIPSIGIVSSAKPSGQEELPPVEPSPLPASVPLIIGKSAPPFAPGTGEEDILNIVPAKVSGKVYGFDVSSGSYRPLANATVAVGENIFKTDSGGGYSTEKEVSSLVDLSAEAQGYSASTVSKVSPGGQRNIHLQPIDNRQRFNPNTITIFYESLGNETPEPENKKYPNLFSFGDVENSRFVSTLIDSELGRYKLEINPVAQKTTVAGKLLIYDVERDGQGRVTNPTQMKNFQLVEDVIFRVGDTEFPEFETEDKSGDENFLLENFVNIHARFNDGNSFSNFVCNAYVVFPNGERVLASRYTGGVPTNVSFRMPKIDGVTYSIEAHAGNAERGSDAVVNDLSANDSVEINLLPIPTGLQPQYTKITGKPVFSWSSVSGAKAYQIEIENVGQKDFRWEGFSRENTLDYPTALSEIPKNKQYRFQLMALDFNLGGLKVLNKAEEISARVLRINSGNGPKFRVQLAEQKTGDLPKGYRVSYNTTLFSAE